MILRSLVVLLCAASLALTGCGGSGTAVLSGSGAVNMPDPPAVTPVDNSANTVEVAVPPAPYIPNPDVFLESPYRASRIPLKGQLHCHTVRSDGRGTPEILMASYARAGYDFACVSDHNMLTAVDFDSSGLIILKGSEINAEWMHVVGIGMTGPVVGQSIRDTVRGIHRQGGLAVLAHPKSQDYGDKWSTGFFASIEEPFMIEVFNGVLLLDAEREWDELLAAGKRMYAVATDDCHADYAYDSGWVVVNSESKSEAGILEALSVGDFYSTRGPALTLEISLDLLKVKTDPNCLVEWIAAGGRVFRSKVAREDQVQVAGDEGSVRVRITRTDGRRAWSNPVYVSMRSGGAGGGLERQREPRRNPSDSRNRQ